MTDRDCEALGIVLEAMENAAAITEDERWRDSFVGAANEIRSVLPDREPRDPADPLALACIPVDTSAFSYDGALERVPDGPVTIALRVGNYVAPAVRMALRESGVGTLLDVACLTRREFAALPGVGSKSLHGIEAAMAERGLRFNDERREA